MDYYNETPIVKKPDTKILIDKLPIDKRQIDYLRKLKVKLENGVNVKILPKTKKLFKELFGLDTDEFKIKKNPSPLEKPLDNEEDELENEEVKPVKSVVKPVEEEVKPSNVDDVINKIVELVLELRPDEKQQKEFVIIHKHYYFKPEKEIYDPEDEDEEENYDTEADENIDEAIEEANNAIKADELRYKTPNVRDQLRQQISKLVFV
jgi:hypothetical protein